MALTAQDINNQSFSIDRKGYDVDEVDVFLERVAAEVDEMNAKIEELTAELEEARAQLEADDTTKPTVIDATVEDIDDDDTDIDVDIDAIEEGETADLIAEKNAIIEDLQAQLDEKKANDSAISSALIIAQRSADEIVSKANDTANETMADAREEADRIINRANADKQVIIDAIRKLEDDREDAREGYADLLRNLIDDASRKLNDLGYDDDIDMIPGIGREAGQIDVIYEEDVAFIPKEAEEAIAPQTSIFEKDLSGYGDIEDNFEDVD